MAGVKDGGAGGPDASMHEPKGGPPSTAPFSGHDNTITTADAKRKLPVACVTAWLSLAIHIAMLPEAGQEPQWATRPHS